MKLSETLKQAWQNRQNPIILTTVDTAGQPNAIYASSVSLYDDERLVVADNYFDKTRRNIHSGSAGSLLFITADKKAYQIKGHFEYHESGPIFDDMKKWNPARHPGVAAAVLLIDEVYQGAKRLTD